MDTPPAPDRRVGAAVAIPGGHGDGGASEILGHEAVIGFVRTPCPADGWTVQVRTRGGRDSIDDRPWLKTRAERKRRSRLSRKGRCKGGNKTSRRDTVFARSQGFCQFGGCPAKATEIHHVIPKRDGGTDALTNQQALCYRHARAVHPEQNPPWNANKGHCYRKRDDHEGLYSAVGLPAAFA